MQNTEFIAGCIGKKLGVIPSNLALKEELPVKEFVPFIKENTLDERKERLVLDDEPFINDTELLFIGTPVWAHAPAPEVQAFLLNYLPKGIPIAVFYCHGGKPDGIVTEIERMAPNNPILGFCDFRSPLKYNKNECTIRAEEWAENIVLRNK